MSRPDELAPARVPAHVQGLAALAGGVAHDFNNLLAVILGYTELILGGLDEGKVERGDVEEIRRAAERAADLTKRLLIFSDREVVRPVLVDLAGLVRDLDSLFEQVLGEDVEVTLDLPSEPCRVFADPAQLEQLLINLAVNAREAMPAGGTLRVSVAVRERPPQETTLPPGRCVCLVVADSGTGMSPDVAEHAFDPFSTTKAGSGARGLGLPMVYGAVKGAGGTIAVTSAPGEGAAFTIRLPYALRPPESQPAAPAGATPPAAGARILLVEDEPAVRRVTARMLEASHHVVIASSGEADALEVLERLDGAVDLLITDLVMADGSGWSLGAEVARRWPFVPTLYMSGYPDDVTARDRLSAPDLPFLRKPFTAEQLGNAVDALTPG